MINYHDTYHDHPLGCLGLRPRPSRFRSFSVKRRGGTLLSLAGELIERQPLADDLPNGQIEAVTVVHALAVVVAEPLLIKVAEQMKWLYRDVRSLQSALQQVPSFCQLYYCRREGLQGCLIGISS